MFDKINSVEGALELLRSAVKERGENYVYPDHYAVCKYAQEEPDGTLTPACIVGVAVYTADGPAGLSALRNAGNMASVRSLEASTNSIFTNPDAARIFDQAQLASDRGENWGAVLEVAEAMARSIIGNREEAVEE